MNERIIFLIRHAQTELSSGKRLIGQYDVRLSSKGIELCKMLNMALQKYDFDFLFSSTLLRAKEMTEIFASSRGKTFQTIEQLNEINLGEWDGLLVEEIKKAYPNEYAARGKNILNYRIPNGENFFDLQKRVIKAFHSILEYDGNLLIIAHSSVNKIIMGDILDIPIKNILKIPQDYGCYNVIIQRENKMNIKIINGCINFI